MNSAIITFKVDRHIKRQAQAIARSMGLTLSDLVRGFLYNLIQTKTITFSARKESTSDIINAIKKAKQLSKKKKKL